MIQKHTTHYFIPNIIWASTYHSNLMLAQEASSGKADFSIKAFNNFSRTLNQFAKAFI